MMMKRFIRNVALALLPLYVIGIVVFFYEPYGYFSSRQRERSRPLFKIFRELKAGPSVVLIGDSRFNQLRGKEALIGGYPGMDSWLNLAWGGARGHELPDMLEYVLKQDPNLRKVYVLASFYTVQVNTQSPISRVEDELKVWKDPIRYLYDRDVMAASFENFLMDMRAKISAGNSNGETGGPDSGTAAADRNGGGKPEKTREEAFMEYAQVIYGVCGRDEGYRLSEDVLGEFCGIARECEEEGIEIVFVIPPIHRTIYDEVIVPLGISGQMEEYKKRLKQAAAVYDMEQYTEFSETDRYFTDGFHLTNEGQEVFIREIFSDEPVYMEKYDKGRE